MIDIAELRETATKTPTTTDRELVWAAADRIEKLEAALHAIREAHDANTPHHEALEKIDQIARSALDPEGNRGDDHRAE